MIFLQHIYIEYIADITVDKERVLAKVPFTGSDGITGEGFQESINENTRVMNSTVNKHQHIRVNTSPVSYTHLDVYKRQLL